MATSQANGPLRLISAFEVEYRGNLSQTFLEALNYFSDKSTNTAADKLYHKCISIIQSSGMGKSRMVDEVGNKIFTIPANLRETLPEGMKAYPPADIALREFFEDHENKSDLQLQAEYAILLMEIFKATTRLVKSKIFAGLNNGSELPSAWAEYLKDGQTDEKTSKNRSDFYGSVLRETKKSISQLPKNSDDLDAQSKEHKSRFTRLLSSAQTMLNSIAPNHSGTRNTCVFYFDEAHTLTMTPQKVIEGTRIRSPYHNLGTVLAELSNLPMFFVFLSTNTHLQKLAPAPRDYASLHASEGSYLIPPFTALPFDVFISDVYKALEITNQPRSLANACTLEVMSGMGRPMWYTHYLQWKLQQDPGPKKAQKVDDIITFANQKLTTRATESANDSKLAAISVRVGVKFNSALSAARKAESRQVESHLRIVFLVPVHREFMLTGYSSEPILAEAAARFLQFVDMGRGIEFLGPEIIAYNYQQGFLAKGERGELCGRLILIIAHDNAVLEYLSAGITKSPQDFTPKFHQPVPVLNFLRALFADQYHADILMATPITESDDALTLELAFANSHVSFSHFALATDSEVLEASNLQMALFRGMAMQAKDNQVSIDAVIPIHMGPITNPIKTETISAINLQFKNRGVSRHCSIDRSITIPDFNVPVISIVFELGEKNPKEPLVEPYHHARPVTRQGQSKPHADDKHYLFVARGCTSKTYKAIPQATERLYDIILGTNDVNECLPPVYRGQSWPQLQSLIPSFDAKTTKAQWALNSQESSSLLALGTKPSTMPSGSGVNAPINKHGLARSHRVQKGLNQSAPLKNPWLQDEVEMPVGAKERAVSQTWEGNAPPSAPASSEQEQSKQPPSLEDMTGDDLDRNTQYGEGSHANSRSKRRNRISSVEGGPVNPPGKKQKHQGTTGL